MGLIGRLGENNERRIKDMEVGETGYALSTFALTFDNKGKPYLNLSATIYERRTTLCGLPITRIGPKKADYDVDITDIPLSYFVKLSKELSDGCNPFGSLVKDEDVVELNYNNPLDAITSEDVDEFIKGR